MKSNKAVLAFFFVIFIDQLSKLFAKGQGSVVLNEGVSFGLGSEMGSGVFVILTMGVLTCLFFAFKTVWRQNWVVWGLLSGAAVSNAVDRVLWGGVQDFLPVPLLHIQNNLADWVIVGCLVWAGWRFYLSETSRNPSNAESR